MKTAIAIDQSITQSGYIRGRVDGSALSIDSFKVDSKYAGDVGAQLMDFEKKLEPRLSGVDLIFIERPIHPHGPTANINTLLPLYALYGHIDYMAQQRGIPCFDVDNGTHKKLIYGKGGAKPQNAIELAASWGFDCKNVDEADACGIFLRSIQKVFPEHFGRFLQIKNDNPKIPFIPQPKKKKK